MKIVIDGKEAEVGGGSSLPSGGSTGQFLAKASDADYEAEWVDAPGGGGSAGEVYSTEETRIGTWIDGKPLYRVVVSGTYPSSGTEHVIFNKVEECVSARGRMHYYTKNLEVDLVIPYLSDRYISVYVENGNVILLQTFSPGCNNQPYSVVLEYTKTTDKRS